MKIQFAKSIAAAAAAGLMGVACGGSTPEPEMPDDAAAEEGAMPEEGGDAMAEEGDDAMAEEGGDAAEAKECCKGMNECKGKGGCKTDANECKGMNECKGKGGCNGHCPGADE